jgi:hypothetical protein
MTARTIWHLIGVALRAYDFTRARELLAMLRANLARPR